MDKAAKKQKKALKRKQRIEQRREYKKEHADRFINDDGPTGTVASMMRSLGSRGNPKDFLVLMNHAIIFDGAGRRYKVAASLPEKLVPGDHVYSNDKDGKLRAVEVIEDNGDTLLVTNDNSKFMLERSEARATAIPRRPRLIHKREAAEYVGDATAAKLFWDARHKCRVLNPKHLGDSGVVRSGEAEPEAPTVAEADEKACARWGGEMDKPFCGDCYACEKMGAAVLRIIAQPALHLAIVKAAYDGNHPLTAVPIGMVQQATKDALGMENEFSEADFPPGWTVNIPMIDAGRDTDSRIHFHETIISRKLTPEEDKAFREGKISGFSRNETTGKMVPVWTTVDANLPPQLKADLDARYSAHDDDDHGGTPHDDNDADRAAKADQHTAALLAEQGHPQVGGPAKKRVQVVDDATDHKGAMSEITEGYDPTPLEEAKKAGAALDDAKAEPAMNGRESWDGVNINQVWESKAASDVEKGRRFFRPSSIDPGAGRVHGSSWYKPRGEGKARTTDMAIDGLKKRWKLYKEG